MKAAAFDFRFVFKAVLRVVRGYRELCIRVSCVVSFRLGLGLGIGDGCQGDGY